MFSLKEYREPTHRLPDLLPWAGLVAPGVVLQKDGLLQRTVAFRGPDVLSSSPHELAQISAQINNALMRLGSGWSLFIEAQRFRTQLYTQARWQQLAPWIVDLERAQHFAQTAHFESKFYLTFVWQLPSDARNKLDGFFFEDAGGTNPEGDRTRERATWRRDLEHFQKTVRETLGMLAPVLPMLEELDDDETLTYLHSTISTQRHLVRAPVSAGAEPPMYLDALLADEPFTAGDNPMLGDNFISTCTIQGFPGLTHPGILDALNYLEAEYRWVTRYIALDKAEATSLISKSRRNWLQRRKGIFTMLKEHAAKEESQLQDETAVDKAKDANAALSALGDDSLAYGFYTATVTVWDRDQKQARDKMVLVKQAIQNRGFTVISETVNSREAWLGSLPGHVYANVRRPILSTQNLAHLLPSSAVWTGDAHNAHMAKTTGMGIPHIQCTTTGATRFNLNLNVQDLGNTLVLGPPGAGKSTLLALLGLQWLKYPSAQVIVFDKGRSARAATLAVGGSMYEPGRASAPFAFQPLRDLESAEDRLAATEFVLTLFEQQGGAPTPALQEHLGEALDTLQRHPKEERTITELTHKLESLDRAYGPVLRPYCRGGAYGQVFDAAEDQLKLAGWTLFEMGHLMEMKEKAIVPALIYLFRRVEQRLTGAPTLIILDEAWLFLSHPIFAARLDNWLRTLRKKDAFVVFATQEVADAARNPALQSTILSNCATKILLANPEATTPVMAPHYASFGLSPTEIETIAAMRKKRDYYARSAAGSRLFTLALGPAQLAFCGMSTERDHRFLDQMVSSRHPNQYVEAILEHRGATWALERVRAQTTVADRRPDELWRQAVHA
jgi:type IV secretion system protein TrbE